MNPPPPPCSVAIFARNEAASLAPCLEAVRVALRGQPAEIHVVLNGCTDASLGIALGFQPDAGQRLRLWRIGLADKSNAWNQYVHALRPRAATHYFVDAYARVAPGAFAALQAALDAQPLAHAAAAVPSSGRSAAATRAAMLANPALHGSLHALRGTVVERIAAAGLRLPVGLYRGDGLIGSLLMHDLDAASPWDPRRIAVAPTASWAVRPLSPWRLADLRRYWNRRVQQARGRLEDAALRALIYRDGFGQLPRSADAMLRHWLEANPAGTDLFSRRAVARLALPRPSFTANALQAEAEA